MFMRRRPLLRTAAVGGGAYAMGHHMAKKSAGQAQQEDEQNERIHDIKQGQGQAPGPAEAAAPSMTDQLNQLTTLHQQGALTDDEFTAAKAKLLGG
jgi:hypothetical protein